jgi:hemolysin III
MIGPLYRCLKPNVASRAMATKPLLRGHFHQAAFFVTLGACIMLIFKSKNVWPVVIYSAGVLTLFGVSALYHRPTWNPQQRLVWRRLDHAAIYLMIAGSFTPVCMIAMTDGTRPLLIVWMAAVLGIIQSVFWINAPKWLASILYVTMGLLILPYLQQLADSLGPDKLALLISGGVVYVLGAVAYATKWPKLWPTVFGYHEVFHLLVIVAAVLHFIMIEGLV